MYVTKVGEHPTRRAVSRRLTPSAAIHSMKRCLACVIAEAYATPWVAATGG
jgi:hypothetical protein